ncbi:copper-binding protein [Bernardetia sp. ABR2-2B]|uniref:copper-binding protein n=1 Tax=Bernardetia sp. ABR2-2B TaxID=3127472 RepID=UPI0030CEDB76
MKKIALLALAATFMFACQSEKKETVEETPVEEMVLLEDTSVEEAEVTVDETPQEDVYSVRGQLVGMTEADEAGHVVVTVNHEEIPDVMMAMKMDFKAEATSMQGMTADDKVSFEMVKTEEGYMMRNVAKLPAETELMLKK